MSHRDIFGFYDNMVDINDEVDGAKETFERCIRSARDEGISEMTVIKMEAVFNGLVGISKLLITEAYEDAMERKEMSDKISRLKEELDNLEGELK